MTLGDERFVSLTTFRRSGDPVSTPVWVARDGDGLVVYTGAESGKVKRLRHDGTVELRACDRRGKVPEGTPTVIATAVVDDAPGAVTDAETLLKAKYGWEFGGIRLLQLAERVLRRGSGPQERVVLRLTVR